MRIDIRADAGQAKREIKSVSRDVRRMGAESTKATRQASRGFRGLAGEVFKGVAAYGALRSAFDGTIGLVRSSVSDVAAFGDETVKMARNVGVSAEALQELQFAAGRSGVDVSSLRNGLKRLSRNMLDAQQGSKRMADMFGALGVEFTNADGTLRGTEEVFRDLTDALAPLGESAESTGARMLLLGRSGAEMGNLMAGGSEGLDAFGDRLDDIGGRLSGGLLAATESYQDAVLDLQTAFFGMQSEIAEGVMPELTDFFGSITAFLASDANTFAEVLVKQTQFFLDLAGGIGQAVKELAGFSELTSADEAINAQVDRLDARVKTMEESAAKNIQIAEELEAQAARIFALPDMLGGGLSEAQLARAEQLQADAALAREAAQQDLEIAEERKRQLAEFAGEAVDRPTAPAADTGERDARAAALRQRLAQQEEERRAKEEAAARAATIRHKAEIDILGVQIATQIELRNVTDEVERVRIQAKAEFAAQAIQIERDLALETIDEQQAGLMRWIATEQEKTEILRAESEQRAAIEAEQERLAAERRDAAIQADRDRAAGQHAIGMASIDLAQGVGDAIIAIDGAVAKNRTKAAKRAFVIQKASALASAIVNTAQGVTNALGMAGPPGANFVMAGLVGALGAAQIATIAAQPPPAGIADAGLSPEMAQRMASTHTTMIVRRDEAIIDPRGTSEISQMLAIQRRRMEMDGEGGGTTLVSVATTPETLRESSRVDQMNQGRLSRPVSATLGV